MGALLFVIIWLAAILGWGMNFIQVITLAMADSPLGTLFFAKLVGIPLAPLGCILGWLG